MASGDNRWSRMFAGAVLLGIAWSSSQAAQHALVVGIDRYRHGCTAGLMDLQGAVNDARLIGSALRKSGINLPDERILLNDQATVENFRLAWGQMLRQARPSDPLIVTFSGTSRAESSCIEICAGEKLSSFLPL